jgi:hypothetical protein
MKIELAITCTAVAVTGFVDHACLAGIASTRFFF